MKLVGLVRARIEYSLVSISKPETKTVTRGKPYKFALLNSPKSCLEEVFQVKSVYLKLDSSKINTLWENCHQFHLAYQNLTKPTYLERGDPRLQLVGFSDSEGPKFQIYIRWKFGQQNSLPIGVFQR